MLILLSPAKTLDMSPVDATVTQPRLLSHTGELADTLRGKSAAELGRLMSISDKLAELNYGRYQDFTLPLTTDRAKAALLAFKGDVYQDLQADDFTERELSFADRQIRILSGLYGILRPRDLMHPYRLEMGTKLRTERGKDLYAFWGDKLTDQLNNDLAEDPTKLVLNLASQEYFKSLQPEQIAGRVLTVHFRELRDGRYKCITFNAKRARGRLARLITLEGITTADPLKELAVNDYVYNDALSEADDWVFTRD
ncbi:Peroxide stress resistance protein YaaA [Neolewinella maritima]|uniref:UPF0246 protein LEM8419_03009 n=1 Tax=Neolewinella maritima TaxID=1383882 RepID=A0ABN8F7W4_9BACT|nr:peroxide stress protein YaaA [Neolewinella maritima]CAH1002092.1 Peroxide stress resistance protein YaaA [Neolewinella maritima]